MNIGIIVYSKTGNTLHVADEIRMSLVKAGFQAEVLRFSAETEHGKTSTQIRLSALPDPNRFDAVIFGAPVQAFSLDPAMSSNLRQIDTLKHVPTLCFITQHFKKSWLGGNRAMKQLLAQLREKRVMAHAIGIVHWSSGEREAQIDRIATQCVKALER